MLCSLTQLLTLYAVWSVRLLTRCQMAYSVEKKPATLQLKSHQYVETCPFRCPIPSKSAWVVAALRGDPWEVLHSSQREARVL